MINIRERGLFFISGSNTLAFISSMAGKVFACSIQFFISESVGVFLTSFFGTVYITIFLKRFSGFLFASSDTESIPASISRSEYSSPIPSIL